MLNTATDNTVSLQDLIDERAKTSSDILYAQQALNDTEYAKEIERIREETNIRIDELNLLLKDTELAKSIVLLADKGRALDKELLNHPDTKAALAASNMPTTKVTDELKIKIETTRKWDQAQLAKMKSEINAKYFPFKTEYKEDVKKFKVLEEMFPEFAENLSVALTTKPKPAIITVTKSESEEDV